MPEVPERPKGVQPRAWEIATKHLRPKYPIGDTKVNPPMPKKFLPKELACEECGESPKDCECDDCSCD